MVRTVRPAARAALLAAFGTAAFYSIYQTGRQAAPETGGALTGLAGKLTGAVPVQELSGLIAVDVEPYFQDPRVQKLLLENGFKLKVQRMGSRDMAARVVPEPFYKRNKVTR